MTAFFLDKTELSYDENCIRECGNFSVFDKILQNVFINLP